MVYLESQILMKVKLVAKRNNQLVEAKTEAEWLKAEKKTTGMELAARKADL